jgi:purine-nucleoside/S-methyl-5'-thioadenosine phosphorylase / adenosine deaminase
MRWNENRGIRWLEADLPGARAAFSTRAGGVSSGAFESLNLGVLTGDRRESVLENRMLLSGALGLDPGSIVIGRQVHGAEIATHRGPQRPPFWSAPEPDPPQVDGHVLTRPGAAALVFVADCLPIAVAGPDGVAMLHGGWRGLAAGIAGAGAERVRGVAAAIGPGIGPCCYEVGEEVLTAFAPLGDDVADGRMLDLKAVARILLERAGVESIEDAGICTRCERTDFFSHRGDGPETGRQAGLAWIAS